MHHLLDSEQPELDGFGTFGPDAQQQQQPDKAAGKKNNEDAVEVAAAEKGKGAKGGKGGEGGVREPVSKEDMRRLGLYAAFFLPLSDSFCPNNKGAKVREIID